MATPVNTGPHPDNAEASALIVLLAAGEGRRYGGPKQLAEIEGQSMLCRVARAALASGAPVLVVTGADAEQVEYALATLPVRIVHHAAWHDGMGSSLAAGIRQLQVDCPAATGALLCLADQPLLDSAMLTRMLARHRVAPQRILVTEHAGVTGPPVLFPRDCFETLMAWSGRYGAHDLLEREAARVERFASDATIDVDTPDDLRRVRDLLAASRPG